MSAGAALTNRVVVGDYRVIYRIEDDRMVVLVVMIVHRGGAYS